MRYLLICALLVISCMPRHQAEYAVSINSFAASPSAPYGTYFLAAADPQLSASDLELREYASYVHRVLGAQGLRPVTAVKDADLAIYLAYGIGEPREHYYAYDEPVWGQTGVSSSRTTTQATIYGNTATATSDTTYTPSYGVTGYRTKVDSYTSFTSWMVLVAFDTAASNRSGQPVEAWRTTITSVGSSGDLRAVFPVMVTAGVDLIGTNTGRIVEREIDEDTVTAYWARYGRAAETKGAQSPQPDFGY